VKPSLLVVRVHDELSDKNNSSISIGQRRLGHVAPPPLLEMKGGNYEDSKSNLPQWQAGFLG